MWRLGWKIELFTITTLLELMILINNDINLRFGSYSVLRAFVATLSSWKGGKELSACVKERECLAFLVSVSVCVCDIFSLFPPWEGVLLELYACVFWKQAPVLPAKTSTAHTCTHRDTNCSPKKTSDLDAYRSTGWAPNHVQMLSRISFCLYFFSIWEFVLIAELCTLGQLLLLLNVLY